MKHHGFWEHQTSNMPCSKRDHGHVQNMNVIMDAVAKRDSKGIPHNMEANTSRQWKSQE